jgi:hypothetical protein
MYYEINNEMLNAIMSAQGEVRGEVLRKDKKFILENGGKKKIKEVEAEIKEMGFPFLYKDIKNNDFYPWGRRILSLLAISYALKKNNREIKEMGFLIAKKPTYLQFLDKKFSNIGKVLQKTVVKWRKDNTIGRLEIVEVNMKEKLAVIRLYNLNFHPIFCDYFAGRLECIGKMIEGENVTCRETKCYFRGEDFFHEFMLKW